MCAAHANSLQCSSLSEKSSFLHISNIMSDPFTSQHFYAVDGRMITDEKSN